MRILPLRIHNQHQAQAIFSSLGVSRPGVKILSPKAVFAAFKIEGLTSWEANIIKQQLLSLGSDAALNRDVLIKKVKTAVVIFGSLSQLKKLSDKLRNQPFGLPQLSGQLELCLNNLFKEDYIFRAGGKILSFKRPVVCGIVNITDDSFSGDGLLKTAASRSQIADLALRQAAQMIKAGAKIIDIGGASSRPFSKPVAENEEIKRVIPAIKALRREFKKVFISVDTYQYKVAQAAAGSGADIINDITALRHSPRLSQLIRNYKLGCILMHMKGMPQTMQIKPGYKDVMAELSLFFRERMAFCAERQIPQENIVLDPGIGFGKRVEDNLTIINHLHKLKVFGRPLLLGLSRKSFIGKSLNLEVGGRLIPSITSGILALLRGADILRVHDVPETQCALKMATKILSN